jgi:MrcB-like, N-terminal domain
MLERRTLVEKTCVVEVKDILEKKGLNQDLSVSGSSGKGNPARVPWVRIYDELKSPSPQEGWYVVFLFDATGSSVSLSLNLGVTNLSPAQISLKRAAARGELEKYGPFIDRREELGAVDSISLGEESGALARLYEKGHVTGFQYSLNAVPQENVLEADLGWLLELLNVLDNLPDSSTSSDSTSNSEDELVTLMNETGWSADFVADVLFGVYANSPQLVFTGPPGTGKTHSAKALARYLLAGSGEEVENRISVVQFHPSYGYEECQDTWHHFAIGRTDSFGWKTASFSY